VAVAELAHPRPVARRRHEAPAPVLDRFEKDGRHRLRAGELYGLLYGVGGPFRVLPGVRDVHDPIRQRLERGFEGGYPGQRERARRCAVVGHPPGHELAPVAFATRLVVLARQRHGRFDRLGTRGDEERAVEFSRRYLGDLVRQLQAPRVLEAPVGEEAELLHLLRGDLGELGPAVPDLRREGPRQPVYVAAAPIVGYVRPLARDDDRQLGPVLGVGREAEHQVLHASQPRGLPVLPKTPHRVHATDHLPRPSRVDIESSRRC
jgi:hypothetical protein